MPPSARLMPTRVLSPKLPGHLLMRRSFLMKPCVVAAAVYRDHEVVGQVQRMLSSLRRRFPADQANKIGSPSLAFVDRIWALAAAVATIVESVEQGAIVNDRA